MTRSGRWATPAIIPSPAFRLETSPRRSPILELVAHVDRSRGAYRTLPDEIGQKLRRAVDDDGPMAVPDQSPRDVDALTVELNDADLMCCSAFHYSEREIAVLSS